MRRSVRELDVATVDEVMRTNFLSPVAMSLALLPRMLERDAGVIVNVSSLGGRLGIRNEAAYCRVEVRALRVVRVDGHGPVVHAVSMSA